MPECRGRLSARTIFNSLPCMHRWSNSSQTDTDTFKRTDRQTDSGRQATCERPCPAGHINTLQSRSVCMKIFFLFSFFLFFYCYDCYKYLPIYLAEVLCHITGLALPSSTLQCNSDVCEALLAHVSTISITRRADFVDLQFHI